MVVLYILLALIGLALIIFSGCVCGRICAQIVRDKNSEANEVLWFWFGFLFTFLAVFCTSCVKDRNE